MKLFYKTIKINIMESNDRDRQLHLKEIILNKNTFCIHFLFDAHIWQLINMFCFSYKCYLIKFNNTWVVKKSTWINAYTRAHGTKHLNIMVNEWYTIYKHSCGHRITVILSPILVPCGIWLVASYKFGQDIMISLPLSVILLFPLTEKYKAS